MAAIPVEIRGTLYDLYRRTARPVLLTGLASRSDLTIGGGPIPPDPGNGGSGGDGDHIWGGGNEPFPTPPIAFPPGWVGGVPPGGGQPPGGGAGGGGGNLPPIMPLPPGLPNVPPPGSPPAVVSGARPIHPMVAPDAVLIEYPGVGKVVVPKPTETIDMPQQQQGSQSGG